MSTLTLMEDELTSEQQTMLAAAGIRFLGTDEYPEVRAECTRIARRLIFSRKKTIGFLPVSKDVAVPPVAIQLGLSLVELTGTTAAYVDANLRYPALVQDSENNLPAMANVFETRWIRDSLAVLTPIAPKHAGEAVPALKTLLREGTSLFEHVLVDLTGFELLGEHTSAAAQMDGMVLVGHGQKTREKDVLRVVQEIPAELCMGVLLVG